jgi:Mlc titration factor MtfA (ptsG expression regulator)/Flp pilus assembly protein TadD
MFFFAKKQRRQELLAEPFPEHWLAYLRENVFLYRVLSEAEQAKVQDSVRILVAEKYWEGCDGLQINEEVQVTVSAQASLLLLGFEDYYFDELRTILVYPGGYLAEDPGEESQDSPGHRLGEAHRKGPVVLSWWHARWDGRWLGNHNLVLHEFAHKLAELGDAEAGMPAINDDKLRARWQKVMAAEYEALCEDVERGRPTLLDPYGATDPAEFFAVATECFFLQPRDLRRQHRQLYGLLAEWYRQDPAGRRKFSAKELSAAAEAESDYIRHSIEELNAVIRLRPGAVGAYRTRADWYWQLGDLDRAIADYGSIIQILPDDPEAYCDRGAAYVAKACYDDALADLDRAIRLGPDYGRAYRERGSAYARKGDFEKAIANFTRALDADPQDAAAYRARALAYAALGEEDKARRDRAKAKRLNAPDDAPDS